MAAAANKSYRVRLSTDVVPKVYDLKLEPDLQKFSFEGIVKITCDVAVASDTITVNTKQLEVASASFTPTGKPTMPANEICTRVKQMTCSFGWDEVLPTGEGVLEIKFRGTLNDQMAGFYRSKYTNAEGKEKYMGVTQFEAIDARRCLPCWDEPGVKAVFIVTMVYPSECTCLSNMPSSQLVTLPDGRRSETFLPTPKMSSYLLAFCLGEYEFISAQTKDGTLCRVFCAPGHTSKCQYALRKCVEALEFYNQFFGIPYPLPKLDMIAIPDFSAGAMENWGLVTYREVLLFCEEATVSASAKHRICTVIAHELAHQWFGNLVTMEWWDDLWLNEGFANWMQTFCSDKLHPEWNIWQGYVAEDQQNALRLDALRSSHPIQVPIGKAETVEEVFDAISYCKGGSVIRMIYAVLGEKAFQEGLKAYFARHQYGNTETTDLWRAWSEASGKPIDEMMGSWTQQMGFPMLKVLSDPMQDNADSIEVEQSWFLADGSQEPGDDAKKWFIPVFIGSDKKQLAEAVFVNQKKQTVSLSGAAAGAAWLKLNLGQHVPTRVLYPSSMIERLAANVKSLPVEDRIGLLSDTYALSKAGVLDVAALGKLLAGYKGETNDKVWSELVSVLAQLEKVMKLGLPQAAVDAFKVVANQIVAPAFKEVGWDTASDDDDNRKKLRSILVGAVAKYCAQDAVIAAEASRKVAAFLQAPSDPASLNADVRAAALSIAMEADPDNLYDKLVVAHNAVHDNAIKKDIYSALGGNPKRALRERFLEWGLTDEVRAQDMIYVPLSVLSAGSEGAEQVFAWITSVYDRLYARLGATSMMLFSHIVKISGAGFASKEKAAEVEAFWKSKPVFDKIERALSQTVEGILTNAKFVDRLQASPLATPDFWKQL